MTKVARQRAANKARALPACDACGRRSHDEPCEDRSPVVAKEITR